MAHHERDWAPYDEFQAKADREIPVVVLEPGQAERPLKLSRRRGRRTGKVKPSRSRVVAYAPRVRYLV